MCGFIAQLVEHRAGIAEVMGSNLVEALIFSGFFFPIGKFTAMIVLHVHCSRCLTSSKTDSHQLESRSRSHQVIIHQSRIPLKIGKWSYPWFWKSKKQQNNYNSCPLVGWKTLTQNLSSFLWHKQSKKNFLKKETWHRDQIQVQLLHHLANTQDGINLQVKKILFEGQSELGRVRANFN